MSSYVLALNKVFLGPLDFERIKFGSSLLIVKNT